MAISSADIDPGGLIVHVHDNQRHAKGRTKRLKFALLLTFAYMVAEGVGGWLTNSLALVADAGHMLTDVAAMGLTLSSIWFAGRPATARKTFGYYRLEILAAFVNGVALVLLSIWVVYEAYSRWESPPKVSGRPMMLIALGGLIVNIVAAKLLHSGHEHDLNMRGAWLHVMGDLLGSAAALIAGVLITGFGWMWADPLTSVLISLIIIGGSWRLISESVNVLLEGTPAHIDLSSVERAILETDGVAGTHDLHVWTISSGIYALSVHISHRESVGHQQLLQRVRAAIHSEFGIDHLTIQMETLDREAEAIYVCDPGTKCFEPAALK